MAFKTYILGSNTSIFLKKVHTFMFIYILVIMLLFFEPIHDFVNDFVPDLLVKFFRLLGVLFGLYAAFYNVLTRDKLNVLATVCIDEDFIKIDYIDDNKENIDYPIIKIDKIEVNFLSYKHRQSRGEEKMNLFAFAYQNNDFIPNYKENLFSFEFFLESDNHVRKLRAVLVKFYKMGIDIKETNRGKESFLLYKKNNKKAIRKAVKKYEMPTHLLPNLDFKI